MNRMNRALREQLKVLYDLQSRHERHIRCTFPTWIEIYREIRAEILAIWRYRIKMAALGVYADYEGAPISKLLNKLAYARERLPIEVCTMMSGARAKRYPVR